MLSGTFMDIKYFLFTITESKGVISVNLLENGGKSGVSDSCVDWLICHFYWVIKYTQLF